MKYTPGPRKNYWGKANDEEQIFQIHKENDSTKITQGGKPNTDISLKELNANVKLTAAPPELLEAAIRIEKYLIDVISDEVNDCDVFIQELGQLQKNIMKAKGK